MLNINQWLWWTNFNSNRQDPPKNPMSEADAEFMFAKLIAKGMTEPDGKFLESFLGLIGLEP